MVEARESASGERAEAVREMATGRKAPPARKTSKPFLRKPVPRGEDHDDSGSLERGKPNYSTINGDSDDGGNGLSSSLERHLSLLDLIAVGVAGTVGSGLFVLAGLVSAEYAGPASVISWLVSGLTACLSGVCYAELSGRIPLAGGSYAYNYVAHGELFAVLAAACLSLEYIAASAAVARSWADKCLIWLAEELEESSWVHEWLDTDAIFSPLAGILSATITWLLLMGVKESKAATNFFTVFKLVVVTTMVFGALYYVQPKNWTPFCPYGVGGVVRGATGTFFGYLGYDQVTALAGEAKSSKRNLPRAIIGVLIFVMLLYMSATLFLTGMNKYDEISTVSGFPDAFRSVGANFLAEFVSFGEIATLPIVILVTIMAQPRLQYAMAVDGLLPPVFGRIDRHGNLWNGTFIAGSAMTIIAACVPFEKLNDMISCAVLTVLALTDSSVVLLWHEGSPQNPHLPGQLMGLFHCLALVFGVALVNFWDLAIGQVTVLIAVVAMGFVCFAVSKWCPRTDTFGGSRKDHYHEDELRKEEGYFRTPYVPLIPCVAIATNWYLIAQLSMVGICYLMAYLAMAVVYYFFYASHHSVGNNGGWESESVDPMELESDPSYSDVSQSERSNASEASTDENTPLNK